MTIKFTPEQEQAIQNAIKSGVVPSVLSGLTVIGFSFSPEESEEGDDRTNRRTGKQPCAVAG